MSKKRELYKSDFEKKMEKIMKDSDAREAEIQKKIDSGVPVYVARGWHIGNMCPNTQRSYKEESGYSEFGFTPNTYCSECRQILSPGMPKIHIERP